ncbi:MAG: 2-phospho-L-lactate transferase [Methanothrix sp.]|uniref:2-phospho-L-lactate transferase n=1 Tax=Methanothrix thermoacetophila (strain DSM 6194 / JCM 14653 / NBRC 101360 / PT) TaxID=349307 RepID=A0B939_METTP|nr:MULTISPECIES: 2-phospho-L-lactate transferase [Methanothrix]ABK15213.1 LPPG:FO 2-phospho-L-lactate transferase [Methanothrix thermoacetophila PT]MBC7079203.1 2-phospho-L-lactate transferase [Methanothrix sp.]NPU86667.1 2-phospho-L-lactate transferase [Methanothrix sp.]
MLILSGGTGTPKLLRGLVRVLDPDEITIVVNTAEDLWVSGNLVSPDIDTVIYTLAGLIDDERWWGIRGDSFITHTRLREMGVKEMLAIGDADRAFHILRSDIIRRGGTLSDATEMMRAALGIRSRVFPMSDESVSTIIATPLGEMHFQEFWVERRGEPEVLGVRFDGIDDARPSKGFLDALRRENTVVIGPSNPVTSISPILSLKGVRGAMAGKTVVAVSPLDGDRPFSGPAARFMKAAGFEPNDEGVISILGDVDHFIVSRSSSYPGRCIRMDTRIDSIEDSMRLAKEILRLAG